MIWHLSLLFVILCGIFFMIQKLLDRDAGRWASVKQLKRAYRGQQDAEHPSQTVGYLSVSMHELRSVSSDPIVEDTYAFLCRSLREHLQKQENDLMTRYEGRNFVFLTCRSSLEYLPAIADFFQEVEQYVQWNALEAMPRIHVGICNISDCDVSFDEAVRRAKQADRTAEESGNRVVHWDSQVQHTLQLTKELMQSMESAIDSDYFQLAFQPIVDMGSGKIIGGEVLSRLDHPQLGVVAPEQFLEALAAADLYAKFDYYIFEKVCAWFRRTRSEGERLKFLSCNFSRQTLSTPDFASRITQIADSYDLPHALLAIEITEEKQEPDTSQARSNLEQLKRGGFQIFLDDFGSGVTSLWDFQNYRVDVVKIDRSMLRQTVTQRGATIFHSLVSMAVELDAAVLCEGIETGREQRFARESGCHYGQGFYFHRPMSAKEFINLI